MCESWMLSSILGGFVRGCFSITHAAVPCFRHVEGLPCERSHNSHSAVKRQGCPCQLHGQLHLQRSNRSVSWVPTAECIWPFRAAASWLRVAAQIWQGVKLSLLTMHDSCNNDHMTHQGTQLGTCPLGVLMIMAIFLLSGQGAIMAISELARAHLFTRHRCLYRLESRPARSFIGMSRAVLEGTRY